MADDLIFLHGNANPRCDARVDKHFNGYYTLQYMDRGAIELSYDDREYRLEGEWCWPAMPGPHIKFHAATGTAAWSHQYVAFRGPAVGRWIADRLMLTEPQPAPAGIALLFDELLAQTTRGGRWGTLRGANLLENILIRLAEARQQASPREPWLDRVMQRIDKHEDFSPDYEAIADEAGMSLSTLRRRFRVSAGMPLHGYAQQCRIAKARQLLGETDLPIKQVAEKLGYNDVYFFSKQFRAASGIPPAAFRKSRQG